MIDPGNYRIRRFEPGDAPGIAACVREVYGEAYPCPELYDAGQILRKNQSGKWMSAVAVDRAEQVVGHMALELSSLGPVAEIGMAMVVPAHQSQGLLKQLHMLLTAEGKKAGLAGHFSDVEPSTPGPLVLPGRVPAQACGLSLGLWPGSARPRGAPASTAGRRSFLVYFRPYDALPGRVVAHVLPEHFEIVSRIYAQFGVDCEMGRPRASEGGDGGRSVHVEALSAWQAMFVRVAAPGSNTAQQIGAAHQEFCQNPGLESAYLELPIADGGTPELCRQAKELGYVFSAVIPRLFGGSDGIRMQFLKTEVDWTSLEVKHPLGREVLGFVREEWRRMQQRSV